MTTLQCEAVKPSGKQCANPADYTVPTDTCRWDACATHRAALKAGQPVAFQRITTQKEDS